jgi:hypothetical protein
LNNENYKGQANNEYAIYQTLDNGRTWAPLDIEVGKSLTLSDRIIYGSTSNQGLRYSDDEGATIVPSDHPSGNYDGITYVDETPKKVYAHNIDTGMLVVSTEEGKDGIGSEWAEVCNIPEGDIDSIKVVDGKVYIKTSDGLTTIKNGNVETFPAAKLENGEIVSDNLDASDYPGILVYILNYILLPKLTVNLTGIKDPNEMSQFLDGITYGNLSYNSFFSNNQLFNGASTSKDWTEDDYRSLLGMFPIELKTESFLNSDYIDPDTPVLLGNNKIDNYPTLKSTLDIIDKILTIKRENAIKNMAKSIAEVGLEEPEVQALEDLDLSPEEYENAVYMQKLFLDVQKSSIVSIMSTALNSIYTFDTGRKVALLRAAIYETVNRSAGAVQYQLKNIEKKLDNPEFTITDDDLSLNYDFSTGLETALSNYFNIIFNNIGKYFDESNSGNKEAAAVWYKNDFREDALSDLRSTVKTISFKFEDVLPEGFKESIESGLREAIEYNETRNAFISEIESILADESVNSIDTSVIVNKDFADGVNAIQNLTKREEIIDALNNIKYKSYEYTNEENIKSLTKQYIENVYNYLVDRIKAILDEIKYEEYNTNEDEDSNKDRETLEIALIEKFKSRALELLEVIFNKHLDNIESGYDYYYEMIDRKIKESLNGGSIDNLDKYLKDIGSNNFILLKSAWLSMCGRI